MPRQTPACIVVSMRSMTACLTRHPERYTHIVASWCPCVHSGSMSRQTSDALSTSVAAAAAADMTPTAAAGKAAEGGEGGQDRALQAGPPGTRKIYSGTDGTGSGLRSGAQSAYMKPSLGSSALTGRWVYGCGCSACALFWFVWLGTDVKGPLEAGPGQFLAHREVGRS